MAEILTIKTLPRKDRHKGNTLFRNGIRIGQIQTGEPFDVTLEALAISDRYQWSGNTKNEAR